MIGLVPEAAAWAGWLLLAAAGVACCALFAGMETGIYVLNKMRLELRAEAGSRPARLLRRMLRKPDNLLAVLLIGTNISAYAATFAVTAMFLLAGYTRRTEWYTLAVAAPVLFVFAESVPKNIFQRFSESLSYSVAWLLAGTSAAFNICGAAPLVQGFAAMLMRLVPAGRRAPWPLGHVGVAVAVAEGHAAGALTRFQSVMAQRVMHIGEVKLRDVMIPMRRVVSIGRSVGRDELLEVIRNHNYSRLPVLDDDGRAVGVLDTYDVLAAADAPPGEKMAQPFVLAADQSITDALYAMQRARRALAVVEDPTGRHLGIVTIKDLVEEIVGELQEW